MFKKKWILTLVMIFTLLGCATTRKDWEKTQSLNTMDAYHEFLKKHPESPFTEEATEEIAWKTAQRTDTSESFRNFLSAHPMGKYEKEARGQLDIKDWEAAKKQDTPQSYRLYLDHHPKGRFDQEAKEAIQLKTMLADCKPVSKILANQIEQEVAKVCGIEQGQSLIVKVLDFNLRVVGLSEHGEKIDITSYFSTGEKGEITKIYSIYNKKPGEPIGYSLNGKLHPTRKVVSYRKVMGSGSTVLFRDGRTFAYLEERWNLCPSRIEQ